MTSFAASLLALSLCLSTGMEDEWVALPKAPAPDGGVPAAPPSDAGAPSEVEVFEAFEPAPMPAARPAGPRLNRAWTELSGLFAIDTRFEPPPPPVGFEEHAVELRSRAVAGADVALADRLRLVVEARARWRGVAQAGLQRAKAEAEAMVSDAFVDLYGRSVDLRVGWQKVTLGATPGLAPADAFNPRDLREGFAVGSWSDDAVLSTFAARAQGDLGPVQWLVAYAPFFEPHRYALFGQDEALLQPVAGMALPLPLDPTIEDGLQEHLLETSRPPGFGYSGDVAARARMKVWGGVTAGAGWLWQWEKLPEVHVDPELSVAIRARSLGQAVDPAVLLSLQNRLAASESLYSGTYPRRHLFWLEGSGLWGPVQLDADVAYSPEQTWFTDRFESLRRPTWTWVLSASPAEEGRFVYGVSYLGMAVNRVPADELLFLVEPPTARGAARTAWFHLVLLAASYSLLDGKVEVSGALALEPIQQSWFFAPQLTVEAVKSVRIGLGAAFYEGPGPSAFGAFDRNDQVVVTASWRP